ncbi:oxalate decarboxylase [Bacillus sp. JCM 19045]|nr:oxalate decarboxylase [Bacillus sp. JCM 19045]
MPGPLATQAVESSYGEVPQTFTHRLLRQEPIVTPGGSVRIVDSRNFPISKTIAAALVELKPGAMREMHWHPNTDEWQYYLAGEARMTVFSGNGIARTFDYRAGDIGYVPFATGTTFKIRARIRSGFWKCLRVICLRMSRSISG